VSLSAYRFWFTQAWTTWRAERDSLGPSVASQLLAGRLGGLSLQRLEVPGCRGAVYLRPQATDGLVLRQVVGQQEYAPVASWPALTTVLDLGANVGLTSWWILQHHPEARIAVVEPDPENLAVARRTLRPWREQLSFWPVGIWPTETDLVLERGQFRDGGAWAYQVRPAGTHEPGTLAALRIDQICDQLGWSRVDFLKMDIEGAETEVLSGDTVRDWLPRVRRLAVECHDAAAIAALQMALSRYWPAGYEVWTLQETTWAVHPTARLTAPAEAAR